MILTRNINREDINIKWLEHKPTLSDHRLAKVTIKTENLERQMEKLRKIKSKKHAEWATYRMLEKILEGNGIEDTIEALE